MKLSVTYAFKAQQEKVFAALVEPAVLQKCIDGCEKMEKTGETSTPRISRSASPASREATSGTSGSRRRTRRSRSRFRPRGKAVRAG